jgi:translation initiation factor 4E
LWFSRKKQGKGPASQAFDQNLKRIYRFATVEQFWEGYNFLKRPCELPSNSDFHLFKDGIKPLWEVSSTMERPSFEMAKRRPWRILAWAMDNGLRDELMKNSMTTPRSPIIGQVS